MGKLKKLTKKYHSPITVSNLHHERRTVPLPIPRTALVKPASPGKSQYKSFLNTLCTVLVQL